MTTKEPFSISISSNLREKIEDYVKKQANKFPNDERYKNKSIFLNYILERVMQIISSGKTLDDLEDLQKMPDSEVKSFFDDITFQAVTEFYESAVKMNRYTPIELLKNPMLFLGYRELLNKGKFSLEEFKRFAERIKNFILKNKLTKDFNLNTYGGKNLKKIKGNVEYSGTFKNLHYENCKGLAVVLGVMGLKVTNFLYSEKELYARFDFVGTKFFGEYSFDASNVTKLVEENLEYLDNYARVVNDEDYYLWMKLANYEEYYITFYDDFLFEKWIEEVIHHFDNYLEDQDFNLKLLKFFESIHWIKLVNDQDKIFSINLSKSKNEREFNFLMQKLNQYGTLIHKGKNYIFKNQN